MMSAVLSLTGPLSLYGAQSQTELASPDMCICEIGGLATAVRLSDVQARTCLKQCPWPHSVAAKCARQCDTQGTKPCVAEKRRKEKRQHRGSMMQQQAKSLENAHTHPGFYNCMELYDVLG